MSVSGDVTFVRKRGSTIIGRLFYSLTLASLTLYYTSRFFAYLFWPAYRWLGLFAFISNVLLVLLFIYLVFTGRWRWMLKVAVVSIVVMSLELFSYGPDRWLVVQGFRIHTLLSPDYLKSCHLTTFKETDGDHAIGLCHRASGFEVCEYIIYDDTDQLSVSFYQRDQDWKRAMTRLASETSAMIFDADEGVHLFGHFYQIHNPPGPC
jgi:hypothetical protein